MLALQHSGLPAASCTEQLQCIASPFWPSIACLSRYRMSFASARVCCRCTKLVASELVPCWPADGALS